MFLKQIELNQEIIDEAIKYFPEDYIRWIKEKSTFEESLVARYAISRHVSEKYFIDKYLPKTDIDGTPVFDKGFVWSISHKDNLVFVWVSDESIWVDIEIIKQRDISLLDNFAQWEYDILWWKNWVNFYSLWVAKESVIKKYLSNLDDINNISLIQTEEISQYFSDINFTKKFVFKYLDSQVIVYIWNDWKKVYGLCV